MAKMGNWTIEQIGSVINAINKQSTGETANIAVTDTGSFVSVAQKTLATAGYEKIMGSISQVLSKTIFSYRPYSAKFKGLEADAIRYGNHVRKIQPCNTDMDTEDNRYDLNGQTLADGDSVDQWKIKKIKTLQTNIYSMDVFSDHYTVFQEQLDTAFSSASEFGNFLSMLMAYFTDKLTVTREGLARAILQNFITGKIKAQNGVFHMLTEYQNETGESLDSFSVMAPENFAPFAKWFKGKLEDIRDGMEDYGLLYHINPTGYKIPRHTPRANQKLYMNNKFLNAIRANVLPDVFNKEFLDFGEVEAVTYWQNQNDPMSIYAKASWMKADGTVDYDSTGLKTQHVIGVLFDQEAMGYTPIFTKMNTTHLNANGDYYNIFAKENRREWNDFTENAMVFILD